MVRRRCCDCSWQISYRQRIAFYFCIFLFYIVQLSLHQKDAESSEYSDENTNQLILFLEIILFLLSLLILLFVWAFRPIYEKYALLWNVFLLSFSLVWLIVHSMNSPQSVINFIIIICILYIDMSTRVQISPQAYVYPWIVDKKRPKQPRSKQKQAGESNDGKKSLFSVSMWNNKKSKSSSTKQKQVNTRKKQKRYHQDYELTASTSSSSGGKAGRKAKKSNAHEFFENEGSVISATSTSQYDINDTESDLNYSIDLERQASLPLSTKSQGEDVEEDDDDLVNEDTTEDREAGVMGESSWLAEDENGESDEGILKNFHFDLTACNPSSTVGTPSGQPQALCTGFRINIGQLPILNAGIPVNLVWSDFTNIQHIVDSSSCHIYIAQWVGHNPYLNNSGGGAPKTDSHHRSGYGGNGIMDDGNAGMEVVIKLIKAERVSSPVAVSEFDMEEQILSRVSHPNIIKLLGSGTVPRKFLVLECLQGGSLAHVLGLRAVDPLLSPGLRPAVTGQLQPTVMISHFSFLELLYMLHDLARALHYLHNQWCDNITILHRDLKPDNIGFNASGQLKLFDFGLAAVVRAQKEATEAYKLTGNTGTLRYMAPEVVLGRAYHQSVDVYSYGVLAWQIASGGKVPFADLGKKAYYDKVVLGGQRLKMKKHWPAGFQALLKACWAEDKNSRPTLHQVVQELKALIVAEEQVVAWQQASSLRRFRDCTQFIYVRIWGWRFLIAFLGLVFLVIGLAFYRDYEEKHTSNSEDDSSTSDLLPISAILLLLGVGLLYGITITYLPALIKLRTDGFSSMWRRKSPTNTINNNTINTGGTSVNNGSIPASPGKSIDGSAARQYRQTARLNSLDSTGITYRQSSLNSPMPVTPATSSKPLMTPLSTPQPQTPGTTIHSKSSYRHPSVRSDTRNDNGIRILELDEQDEVSTRISSTHTAAKLSTKFSAVDHQYQMNINPMYQQHQQVLSSSTVVATNGNEV